jgi:hypothetical protein
MSTPAQDRAALAALEDHVTFQKAIRRSFELALDDKYYDREHERLSRLVETYTKQLNELEQLRRDGHDGMAQCTKRIRSAYRQIKLLKNSKKIDRLVELDEKLRELRASGIDVDALLAANAAAEEVQ